MERKTVLLVDDSPANLKLLVDCLESHDLKVAVAQNGEEALQRLQRTHLTKPDLILLDVMMPGIDGYETCRRIRSTPELKDIPVIFLSALSETSDMVSGFSVGAVDYITKPINLAEMMARINTHLELSELRHQLDMRVKIRTQELTDANNLLRHEIEERKRAEAQIGYIATHDTLTDLPNRLLLQEQLRELMSRAPRHNENVALILLDLDQFKVVNDSLGHNVGDMLLNEVACRLQETTDRLQGTTQDKGFVARLGGDEFAICLLVHKQNEEVETIARTLFDSLREPLKIDNLDLHIGASIGVAVYPKDGTDEITLMRNADAAMNHAKQSGRAEIKRYSAELNANVQSHLGLSSLLASAAKNDEIFVEYQPQIDLSTGQIIGAEALMRWRRRDGVLVSPAEFIPVAEANGLIKEIGERGLQLSCEELKRWHDAGYDDLCMSVNISVPQLHSTAFVDGIRQVVNEFQLPPSSLELEITESLLMQHSKTNLNILRGLSKFGVRLSVDDFGTGYSSLAYLQDFPVDALKIDISFVRNIGTEHGNAIPSAIIAMAHSLRLKVVAEGIETEAQEAFLRSRGCDFAQGFYYGRSMSGENFLELCRNQSAAE